MKHLCDFKRFQEALRGLDASDAWKTCERLNKRIQKPDDRHWDLDDRTRSMLDRLRSKIDRVYWDDMEDNPLQVDCRKGWHFDPNSGDFYRM